LGPVRGQFAGVTLATTSAIALASCSSAAGSLSTRIVLEATQIVAGQPIKGTLVLANPGEAVDLTAVSHPFGHLHSPYHCKPAFEVYLTNGVVENEEGFTDECVAKPFVIAHGTTKLPFTLPTTYSRCTQTGPGAPSTPPCGPTGLPPLPLGNYRATVAWSEVVPVPAPSPVTVVVTGG
jgi:hypothetical protein